MAAYQAALAGVTATTTQIGANRTKPGTLNAAVVGFYQSIDFQELSARHEGYAAGDTGAPAL